MRLPFSITLYSFLEWGSLRASSFIFFWKDMHWRINIIVVGFRNSIYQMGCFLLQHDNTCYSWARKDIYFFIHVILQFRNKSWSVSFTPSLIRIHFVKLQRWPWFVWKVSDWSGNMLQNRDLWWFDGIIMLCWHDLFGISGTALNIFRGTLRELIFARNFPFFKFLRELIFEKMAIPNIPHELKLANFAKY